MKKLTACHLQVFATLQVARDYMIKGGIIQDMLSLNSSTVYRIERMYNMYVLQARSLSKNHWEWHAVDNGTLDNIKDLRALQPLGQDPDHQDACYRPTASVNFNIDMQFNRPDWNETLLQTIFRILKHGTAGVRAPADGDHRIC